MSFDVETWLSERSVDPSALTWDDYVGAEVAKREIRGIVARLAHRADLAAVGMAIPKGILIHGEPGVGKTYLARVMASDLLRTVSDISFFEISAAEFDSVERLETVLGALRSRKVMTVVALDDADVFGLERWSSRQNPASRAILLAFLSSLDGLRSLDNVFWVLTANAEVESFDPAVVRPGRIELTIPLHRPSPAERRALFTYYASRVPTDPAANLEAAAELVGSATPARVRGVMADAYALALGDGGKVVTDVSLLEAIRRDGVISDDPEGARLLRSYSIHEAGHAIVGAVLGYPPTLIITARHDGGMNEDEDEDDDDRDMPESYGELRARMIVCHAGIEAERLILGPDETSVGGSRDLHQAAKFASVCIQNGLVPGYLVLSNQMLPGTIPADRETKGSARLLKIASAEAIRLVTRYRPAIERLAALLVTERHMAGAVLRDALAQALAEETSPPD